MSRTINYFLFTFLLLLAFYQFYSRGSFYFTTTTTTTTTTPIALKPVDYANKHQNLVHEFQNTTRVKACFVILVRNSDLSDMRWTIRPLEARFNSKYNYPYVF